MCDHRKLSVLFLVFNNYNGILHHMEGHNTSKISRLLREEGVKVSPVGISKFLAKFEKTGWMKDKIWQTIKNNSRKKKN